jgi:hypothetical protein
MRSASPNTSTSTESFTRTYIDYGIKHTSIEVAIILPYNKAAWPLLRSIILDRIGRIVALLTGGGGTTDETDLSYSTAPRTGGRTDEGLPWPLPPRRRRLGRELDSTRNGLLDGLFPQYVTSSLFSSPLISYRHTPFCPFRPLPSLPSPFHPPHLSICTLSRWIAV